MSDDERKIEADRLLDEIWAVLKLREKLLSGDMPTLFAVAELARNVPDAKSFRAAMYALARREFGGA